jgi:hypothetical protein
MSELDTHVQVRADDLRAGDYVLDRQYTYAFEPPKYTWMQIQRIEGHARYFKIEATNGKYWFVDRHQKLHVRTCNRPRQQFEDEITIPATEVRVGDRIHNDVTGQWDPVTHVYIDGRQQTRLSTATRWITYRNRHQNIVVRPPTSQPTP